MLPRTYLVHTMSQAFQLLHSPPSLFVRIIACPYCAHAGWLVACIALRAVIEVRIWSAGTVTVCSSEIELLLMSDRYDHLHTYVPGHRYMWTSVGLAHYSNHSDL